MSLRQTCTHGHNFGAQQVWVACGSDDRVANGFKTLLQGAVSQYATCPCDGLMLPRPGGVRAALLLVIGIRRKAGNQQSGVAIGSQCGVNFVQIALASFDSQPVDEFAHQSAISLVGTFIIIVI